jgi:hypothetical protein
MSDEQRSKNELTWGEVLMPFWGICLLVANICLMISAIGALIKGDIAYAAFYIALGNRCTISAQRFNPNGKE